MVVGAGGATGQLVGDVQVRLAPIGAREAEAMVAGLRTFPLLDGFRGRPRADLAAVHDAVLRVGVLAAAHPEVAELDCDPVVAGPGGRGRGRRARAAGAAAGGAAVRGAGAVSSSVARAAAPAHVNGGHRGGGSEGGGISSRAAMLRPGARR